MKIILLIAAVCSILLIAACGSSPEPEATSAPAATATTIPTEQPTSAPTLKPTPMPIEAPTLRPQRAEAIGKSDKAVSMISDGIVMSDSVRNDVTGKWRLCRASYSANIEDFALSYYNTYFKSASEVHWIVNFTMHTTTCVTYSSGVIYLDVHEYVDREELDAKTLGNGVILAKFAIYTDNGDIERLN